MIRLVATIVVCALFWAGCGRVGFDALVASAATGSDADIGDAGMQRGAALIVDAAVDGSSTMADAGADSGALLPPFLGSQYVRVQVDTFTTSSVSFVDVGGGVVRFTPRAADETWIVLLSCRLSSTLISSTATEIQYVTSDGTPVGFGGGNNTRPGEGVSWQHFYWVTGSTDSQSLQVQVRTVGGETTVEDLRMVAFPLPRRAEVHGINQPAESAVTPAEWRDYATLDFVADTAGEYLVLATATATEQPGVQSVRLRIADPSATFWPTNDSLWNHRSGWRSLFWARVQSLGAGPQSFRLEAEGSAGLGSTLRDARILAIRTDAFEQVESTHDLLGGPVVSGSIPPVVASTLSTEAVGVERDYIAIQSVVAWGGDQSDPDVTRGRRTEFWADGELRAQYTAYNTEAGPKVADAYFDAITSRLPILYQNAYASVSSSGLPTMAVEDSVIHVLRLRP